MKGNATDPWCQIFPTSFSLSTQFVAFTLLFVIWGHKMMPPPLALHLHSRPKGKEERYEEKGWGQSQIPSIFYMHLIG